MREEGFALCQRASLRRYGLDNQNDRNHCKADGGPDYNQVYIANYAYNYNAYKYNAYNYAYNYAYAYNAYKLNAFKYNTYNAYTRMPKT